MNEGKLAKNWERDWDTERDNWEAERREISISGIKNKERLREVLHMEERNERHWNNSIGFMMHVRNIHDLVALETTF